jgi:hypothetical protein
MSKIICPVVVHIQMQLTLPWTERCYAASPSFSDDRPLEALEALTYTAVR